jgi:hypothetical protein
MRGLGLRYLAQRSLSAAAIESLSHTERGDRGGGSHESLSGDAFQPSQWKLISPRQFSQTRAHRGLSPARADRAPELAVSAPLAASW